MKYFQVSVETVFVAGSSAFRLGWADSVEGGWALLMKCDNNK